MAEQTPHIPFEDTKENILPHLNAQNKHYGLYQLCPKCEGQGRILTPPGLPHGVTEWSSSATDWECDVCNGQKLLVRPEIKKEEPGE